MGRANWELVGLRFGMKIVFIDFHGSLVEGDGLLRSGAAGGVRELPWNRLR